MSSYTFRFSSVSSLRFSLISSRKALSFIPLFLLQKSLNRPHDIPPILLERDQNFRSLFRQRVIFAIGSAGRLAHRSLDQPLLRQSHQGGVDRSFTHNQSVSLQGFGQLIPIDRPATDDGQNAPFQNPLENLTTKRHLLTYLAKQYRWPKKKSVLVADESILYYNIV